jgi:hypothetical protein
MNQDTENFEQLRRLLVLKRHEQPPPGYFNSFSDQVIARIKSGDKGETGDFLERLFGEAPWIQRIWAILEAKPVLAGVFGVAVCGLLITGVVYSDKADVSSVALVPGTEVESAPMALANVSMADHPLLAKPVAFEPSSTQPVDMTQTPQTTESLLSAIGKLQPDRAAFNFSGGK